MRTIFSYDSPVWKFVGRLIDFLVLTLLWFVTSLPIITIGTATTTVYYITLKMTEDQEEYLIRMYFKNFAKLFKQTTKVWLMVLAVGAVLCGDFYICMRVQTPVTTMLMAAFFLITVVFLMTSAYLFPVMAWLDGNIAAYLKAAFYLSIKYLGWTILILVIAVCLIALGVFVFWPLLLIVVGLTAYLQSLIFRQIFNRQ
ncbi:MAG: DUF624 domain-containing protein [Clostridiales bacterium]|nr:DUF624 domain-containing protein [Clostridiales bacterium]